jgi:dTDP-4-amino-4,6-dideoxygalactose transaminase
MAEQSIDESDIAAAVIDVLKSDYLTQGPVPLSEFEAALCEYTGAQNML